MNDNVFAKATVIFIALFIRKNNFRLNIINIIMKNKCMWQYSFMLALTYLLLTIFFTWSLLKGVYKLRNFWLWLKHRFLWCFFFISQVFRLWKINCSFSIRCLSSGDISHDLNYLKAKNLFGQSTQNYE